MRSTWESRRSARSAEVADAERWDWYGPPHPEYPRARDNQHPPAGDWSVWCTLAGRAFGKTLAKAHYVRTEAESGRVRRIALVGATAADVRDTMVRGVSGLLSIGPESTRPKYEPSKRSLTWPNGCQALLFSAEEPDRLRGFEAELAWCDELCAWSSPEAFSNLALGMRGGGRSGNPRIVISTTPKRVKLIHDLVNDPRAVIVRGSTYDNRANLPAAYFDRIVAMYEGTRLGRQELHAELLDTSEGAVYESFDPTKHVTTDAEFKGHLPYVISIDCGVSKSTAALGAQLGRDLSNRPVVRIFAEWYSDKAQSLSAAQQIREHMRAAAGGAEPDRVILDPFGAKASSSLGIAAYHSHEETFGSKVVKFWPRHRVCDGIDQVELLIDQGRFLVHPRCKGVVDAMNNYVWKTARAGEFDTSKPADPCHPHEDYADAWRGVVREFWPEGVIVPPTNLRDIRAGRVF